MADSTAYWPHAPTHQLSEAGTYIVTAATYRKDHHFRRVERLDVLQRGLWKVSARHGWRLEAWAVFSNHYHFVAHSPADVPTAESLRRMLHDLHTKTAAWVNRLDGSPGRQVWHNYWETRLTFQNSYLARLNYVHQNPVKHGLVADARDYPWCSASWLENASSPASVKTIVAFKIDRVNVLDPFDPLPP